MATLDATSILDGAQEPTNLVGSQNTVVTKQPKNNSRRADVLIYPSARDVREYEDSFMIKAIKYVVPQDGEGVGVNIVSNAPGRESGQAYLLGHRNFPDKEKQSLIKLYKEKTGKDGTFGEALNHYEGYGDMNFEAKHASLKVKNQDKTDIIEKRGHNLETKYFVELPIPQQLSDTNSVSWGDETMNIFEMAGLAIGKAAMELDGVGVGQISAAINAMTKGMDLDIQDDVSNSIKAALSGQAMSALGSTLDVNSILSRSTGTVLNSNLELLFRGANLRTFPFDITFSPRSPKETKVVKNIIRKLKQSMAVRRGAVNKSFGGEARLFLGAPDLFLLRYLKSGKDHPFLNAFKPCALTQLNVNYTGAGTYSTYGDSTPTNIQMRMVFKEVNPIYAEDYDEDVAGPGVGF